jgi:hypothetical protein
LLLGFLQDAFRCGPRIVETFSKAGCQVCSSPPISQGVLQKSVTNSHASDHSALEIGLLVLSTQAVLVLQGKLEIAQGLPKAGRREPLERILRIAVA